MVQLTKNTAVAYSVEIASRFFTFLLLIYAARQMGVSSYGELSYALAIMTILGVVSEFGASNLLVKLFAQNTASDSDFGSYSLIRIFITILSLLLLVCLHLAIGSSREVLIFSIVMGAGMVLGCYGQNIGFVFRGRNKMHIDGIIRMSVAFLSALLGLIALRFGFGLVGIAVAYFVAYSFSSILAYRINSSDPVVHFVINYRWSDYSRISKQASVFFVWTLIGMLYLKVDTIILQHMSGSSDVAIYNVAMRVVEAVAIIPMALYNGILPVFSGLLAQRDIVAVQSVSRLIIKYMTYAGFFICGFLIMNAEKVIEVLYFSDAYSASVLPLQILLSGTAFSFLYMVFAVILVASHASRMTVWLSCISTMANFLLNIIFIPKYGVLGAAYVRLATEVIGFALLTGYVSVRIVRVKFAPYFIVAAIAMGLTGILIWTVKSLLLLPIYFIVYVSIIYAMKGIRDQEVVELVGLIRTGMRAK